jgi:hypothetical protein
MTLIPTDKKAREKLRKRITSKVERTDTGCWEWIGWDIGGYGMISLTLGKRQKTVPVARVMWELEGHALPRGHRLAHLCGNTMCIRPDHLQVQHHAGGPSRSGGQFRGSDHPSAKLTEDQVREIRRLRRQESKPYSVIGEQFGIDETTARRICVGQTWRHVK